jgi:phasin family protein
MASKPSGGNFPFNIDLTEMFARMKLPFMPDMQALVAAQRRNIEALIAANKVALEGAQAVARRNLEIMQQTMVELAESTQAMASPEAPQAKAAKQAEMVKKTYEQAVTNMKELGEMIQHTNAEAVEVLNKRFAEAMDEVKVLAQKVEGPALIYSFTRSLHGNSALEFGSAEHDIDRSPIGGKRQKAGLELRIRRRSSPRRRRSP